jgi:2-polyprenyl-3-methyl-5-hydroxy-6-metoxy-1,4-benzoquinol methylase
MMDFSRRISQQVRSQYLKYPYPDIDPERQSPQLLVSGHLSLMCDILWAGKRTPDRLRVLDAGCGTGSPLVAMALAYPNADIVGVDFSETSLIKARQLARRHQVQNVRFYNLAIEQLPGLGMTFDFVVSSGVLHHLPKPARGLEAIANVLDPQGAVSIMVYGRYGRRGIYMLQEALKTIFESNKSTEEKIPFARRLAHQVPPNHPMSRRSKGMELREGKDAGIVDLLLHANDIPFDVTGIYRMCQDAGMRFYRWLFPFIYEPDNYFKDPVILKSLKNLSSQQKHEIAELVHGRNSKHSFFAVKPEFSSPAVDISNGNWRNLHARLTPCLAWNRTVPVPGQKGKFVIPPAIIQDDWGPLEISHWQLMFLSRILPENPLGSIIRMPAIRKIVPFKSRAAVDHAVETLLKKILDHLGIVLLEK